MLFKKNRKLKWSILIFLSGWIIFAQSCMKFRIDDSEARRSFEEKNIPAGLVTVKIQGFDLHYVKTGIDSLPTLFFIHGSPGSWDAYRTYMMDTALLRRFRMISIDRPGFGYSGFGNAVRLPEQAFLINKIVERESNRQPVHLVGHSIGGPVIVRMAQDYPTAYASLTILAGSISPGDEPKEYWRYLFTYSPLKLLMPGAFKPSNDEIVYFKEDLHSIDTGYSIIKIPVTFIHGDADKFVTVKNVEYGKKKLAHNPDVKIIIIPGAGHFIPWQHYAVIKQHLMGLPKKLD